MKILEQSKHLIFLLNVVGKGFSRNRLDSPLPTPLSFGKLVFMTEEQGEGRQRGGRGEGEKESVSLDQGRLEERGGDILLPHHLLEQKGKFNRNSKR